MDTEEGEHIQVVPVDVVTYSNEEKDMQWRIFITLDDARDLNNLIRKAVDTIRGRQHDL